MKLWDKNKIFSFAIKNTVSNLWYVNATYPDTYQMLSFKKSHVSLDQLELKIEF